MYIYISIKYDINTFDDHHTIVTKIKNDFDLNVYTKPISPCKKKSLFEMTLNKKDDSFNELGSFLAKEIIDSTCDPIKYYQDHSKIYPKLSACSKMFFGAPASSVPCEAIFSLAGNTVTKKRCRLESKTIKNIIFLNSYFKNNNQ